MILSDTAIRRPVFATMMIAIIIVFGVVSFREIGIDLFPRVEFPVITMISVLPGADPETVETTVTDPIEQAVSTISLIKRLRSTSAEGVSQIIIEFELEKNIDVAYQEVQAKLGTIRADLPLDTEPTVVEKFDIDAAPIIAIVVSGDIPVRDLTYVADKVIKERLQRVRNVGQVKVVGGRKRNIWLLLDRSKLEGYRLSVQDVTNALQQEHIEYPGGRVETGPLEYVVKTKAEFTDAEGFDNMLITYRNNAPVRLKDIGRAEDGLEEERSQARLDEKRAVSLLVRRQSGTNTVEVAHGVQHEVAQLQQELAPQGIKLDIAQDLSIYIEHSVREVQFHLLFGGGLAVFIVLLFLRNVRSTLICACVLPVSVIGTFSLMHGMGFTQNMLTLLALTLAIGLLIDDSIVVQENTMRHVEEGMPPRQAASFATNEIALAVFATTMSVVAVFVPVAFTKGMIGRFFYQFGLTVAFAVLISMFVSFTLDPMLSSRVLRKPKQGRLYQFSEYPFLLLEKGYAWLLSVALRYRSLVVLLIFLTLASTVYLARYLRAEFVPLEDQSEFTIRVKTPLGSSLTVSDAVMAKIRSRLYGRPWLAYVFSTIGADELQRVNEGSMYIKMKPKNMRETGQQAAMEWTRRALADFREAKLSIEIVPRVSGGGMKSTDIQLELRGKELDRMDKICSEVMSRMRDAGGYADLDTTYENNKPEINVYVNRESAADLGVSSLDIASTVKALVGGADVGKFRAEGERYDVSIRLLADFRNQPEDIEMLNVKNSQGRLIRLDNVAQAKKQSGPVQINRYNRTRQITVLANLERDKKILGEAVAEITNFMLEIGMPPGYNFNFTGMAEMMQESFANLLFALYFGIIIVYIVLASQFESFIHPFTIMLSVPLSAIGAFGALLATGLSMSIFTMIGIIMLMGLVTKNGILLIDFTNTLRHRDRMERNAAILKAGPIRLRPILMTTMAMIFGMLPAALGTGEGSETRAPMAVTIIGGLVTSTLLTLLVVPVVYTLLDDLVHPEKWRLVRWLRR
jgi:HAE1 family hydrophobic/amphiphilic exporter-1